VSDGVANGVAVISTVGDGVSVCVNVGVNVGVGVGDAPALKLGVIVG